MNAETEKVKPEGGQQRRSRIERRISVFLNQDEAGRKLGYSGPWLCRKAKEHDLYKSTIGGGCQGSPRLYHPDHIDHIIKFWLVRDLGMTEDEALREWNRKRQAVLSEMKGRIPAEGKKGPK